MLRLCFQYLNVNLTILNKFGVKKYIIESDIPFAKLDLRFMLDLTGSTNVTFVKEEADCIPRLANNESDICSGFIPYYGEDDSYHVPVPFWPYVPVIITGFEADTDMETKVTRANNLGVISNMFSYDWTIYAFFSSLIIILYSMSYLNNYIKKTVRRKVLRTKFDSRILSLIFWFSFFFISTPFLLLFKTKQVVMEKPNLLIDFETIMMQNATIIPGTFNTSLVPNDNNIKNRDIKYKFWQYYTKHVHNPHYRGLPKSKRFPLIYEVVKGIVAQKLIFLGPNIHIDSNRIFFCMFSKENEYFRTFTFKDTLATEFLSGYAVRNDYFNPKLIKRFRNSYEFNSFKHSGLTNPQPTDYTMFTGVSLQHKMKQKHLCQSESISLNIRKGSGSTNLNFFKYFLLIIFSLLFISFIVLIIELFTP